MEYPLTLCTVLLLICASTSPETLYVTVNSNQHCPEQNVSCLTLSQYAAMPKTYFASNTAFVFLPGNHILDSELSVTNITNVSFASYRTVATVICSHCSVIRIESLTHVVINELVFSGCTASISLVHSVALQACKFHGNYCNESGLRLNWVMDTNIVRSTFSQLSTNVTCDTEYGLRSVGGAVSCNRSNITVTSSSFDWNTADLGGVIYAVDSSLWVHNSTFKDNIANKGGGAVCINGSNALVNSSMFENNTAFYSGAFRADGSNIVIINSTFLDNKASSDGGAMSAVYSNITVSESAFRNNIATRYAGAIEIINEFVLYSQRTDLHIATAAIVYSDFTNNSAHIGGALDLYKPDNIYLNSTSFLQNTASYGGTMYIESTRLYSGDFLLIHNNSALTGVVYVLKSKVDLFGNTTFSNNKGSFVSFASNLTIADYTRFENNIQELSNRDEGGAVTSFQSLVVFIGTTELIANSATNGGAILATETNLYTYGNLTISKNHAKKFGGAIYMYQGEQVFKGNTVIHGNYAIENGGGVYAISSTTRVSSGSLKFVSNNASKGGGMFLELNAKLYVSKSEQEPLTTDASKWLRLEFTSNNANFGGALYVDDDTYSGGCDPDVHVQSTASECFFQSLALYNFNYSAVNILNTFFVNNSANVAGGTLYGGLLDRCTVSPFAEIFRTYVDLTPASVSAISYFQSTTSLEEQDIKSQLSSDSVQVCYCRDAQPDCSYQPSTVLIRKGQTFSIQAVAVDDVNNTISYVGILSSFSIQAGLSEGQSVQKTGAGCSTLNYTIVSPLGAEQLLLYADGPCKDSTRSTAGLNVKFTSCPIGFKETTTQCECDDELYPRYVYNCSVDTETVLRKGNSWISFVNSTDVQGFLTHQNCPFDYCYPVPNHINLAVPDGTDLQCAFNRSGLLCGSCKVGLSLTLGSSRCKECSNVWLILLIPFAILGIALVALLLVCNLTVAIGTINGLIFYANIVIANRTIYFPFNQTNICTVFISWLSLNLGLEVCFYNGMDAYGKVWLQLAFQCYVITLLVLVILSCKYSQKFANLLMDKNPVATLATLLLLSYEKLCRNMFSLLSFVHLKYPDGSYKTVWLFDPNMTYLNHKHIALFVVAVLILISGFLFIFVLIFGQWLLHLHNWRAFNWLNNAKIKAFLDAYHAPYKPNHRYWTGLLLLVRIILYTASETLTVGGNPNHNLLLVLSSVIGLITVKMIILKVYENRAVDFLETSFFINLIILSYLTMYLREVNGDGQEILVYASTSVVVITFVIVLLYHSYAFVVKKTSVGRKFATLWTHFTQKSESHTQPSSTFLSEPLIPGYENSGSQLREPLDLADNITPEDYNQAEPVTFRPKEHPVTYGVVDAPR